MATDSPMYAPVRTSSPETPSNDASPRYTRASPGKRLASLRPSKVILFVTVIAIIALPLLFRHRDDIPVYFGSKYVHTDLTMQHIPEASGGLPEDLAVPLTLEARLSYLLSRPALMQWEAELPSRHACPFYTFSRNTYFFHDGKPEQWERVGPSDIRRYRSKIVDYLRGVEREGGRLVWDPSMEADVPRELRRGIIFTGAEGKTLDRLRLSLHMLRNVLHSTLPIEMYHFPDEMQDVQLRQELKSEFDITLRMVEGKRPDGKSWNIKNIAFLATNFTEFVYMDSDNIPLADPNELFDSVEYKQSGSVFWADLNKDHPDNAIFRVMGRPCTDDHWPAEAGQLIFDKRGNNGLNLAVLHLSNHMMANDDMYGFLSYGDKDTFRFSFYALGLHYQQAPKIFASAGGYQTQGGETSNDFCGHSMIQWGLTPVSAKHDPSYHPRPAFLHAILAKHRWNLQPDKLFSHIRRPRLDGILEPRLVRTLYEFTGDCFALTLKGPDGLPGVDNSMLDGQGVEMVDMREVLGKDEVWEALKEISERFVMINHSE
ncbi:mannosyltransferase putative-domain-containing protein [Naematelia encephala]|uniref:Mannosyltransferase putative-domain-containing protein n=1 Tax=Naematelia encephala TaxID=71784 RepID=A0A1Y2B535_9TREE|nr:mannosyltransferase putative-domain-containing protein [Naematelia encephala]